MYGVIDFSRVDTTPGAPSAFAPPAGFNGDYMAYMRMRWKQDRGVRQHVTVVAMLVAEHFPVTFMGPYAEEAAEIVRRINGARRSSR